MLERTTANQDKFWKWLLPRVPNSKLFEYYSYIEKIDIFCKKQKISSTSLLDICDLNSLYRIKTALSENKVFKRAYFKKLSQLTYILELYTNFLQEESLKENNICVTSKVDLNEKNQEKENTCCIANNDFWEWLTEKRVPPKDIQRFEFLLEDINKFCKEKKYLNESLFAISKLEFADVKRKLLEDKLFGFTFSQKFKNMEDFLKTYEFYLEQQNNIPQKVKSEPQPLKPEYSSIDCSLFSKLLLQKFPKGFRINSFIDMNNFKKIWEGEYKTAINLTEKEIREKILTICIVYNDKALLPELMCTNDVRLRLFSYIQTCFDSGKKILSFESLYKEFEEELLDSQINDKDMLKQYLDFMNDNSYYIAQDFISSQKDVDTDYNQEIKNYLLALHSPTKKEKIFSYFAHIPSKNVKYALSEHNGIITNSKYGEYFHIDTVVLNQHDLDNITHIICMTIEEKNFIGGNELLEIIQKKYPHIIEHNNELSELGLRNSIKHKLEGKFMFRGSIISSLEFPLDTAEIIKSFSKNHSKFTLDEIKALKEEINATNVYFEKIYEHCIRVNHQNFVAKENVSFCTAEIDNAISRFCTGEYIPISAITSFTSFPDINFSWNHFLLENYVAQYSSVYRLLHADFAESTCVGAIVKKSSSIKTFEELLIDVLSKSGLAKFCKQDALNILKDKGYLARQQYKNIEFIIQKAIEARNQKGHN